jgi:hypothetical protein
MSVAKVPLLAFILLDSSFTRSCKSSSPGFDLQARDSSIDSVYTLYRKGLPALFDTNGEAGAVL